MYETLTSRERGVLHLAAEGHGNPEIAARLAISVRTAETHRANLMRKLGLRNQTDEVPLCPPPGALAQSEQPVDQIVDEAFDLLRPPGSASWRLCHRDQPWQQVHEHIGK